MLCFWWGKLTACPPNFFWTNDILPFIYWLHPIAISHAALVVVRLVLSLHSAIDPVARAPISFSRNCLPFKTDLLHNALKSSTRTLVTIEVVIEQLHLLKQSSRRDQTVFRHQQKHQHIKKCVTGQFCQNQKYHFFVNKYVTAEVCQKCEFLSVRIQCSLYFVHQSWSWGIKMANEALYVIP